jgi:hypothetical protein
MGRANISPELNPDSYIAAPYEGTVAASVNRTKMLHVKRFAIA